MRGPEAQDHPVFSGLLDSGRNPKHVQYIAGHKTFAMTMDTYRKFRPEALLESTSRLPYFLEEASEKSEADEDAPKVAG